MGRLKVWDDGNAEWVMVGGTRMYVQADSPGTPAQGDSLWYDTDDFSNDGVPSSYEGTSFPASPTDGMRFYRSDVRGGLWFRYDAGDDYWYSEQEYCLTFDTHTTGQSSDVTFMFQPLPFDYDAYFTHAEIALYLNGSGSWTWYADLYGVDWSTSTLYSKSDTETGAQRVFGYSEAIGTLVESSAANTGSNPKGVRLRLDETAGTATTYGAMHLFYRLAIAGA
jgi:hypothetical protein